MGLSTVRAEALRAAFLAALAGVLVAALAPPGGDSAAHLYRTLLVREGVAVWDNLWFGGHYPLASYSLLYYLPAAVVGNVPLVLGATVATAALFGAVATEEWGADAAWPARIFGLLAAGPLFTGTYSYALGLAAGLGALRLLQLGRPRLAVGAGALALGFSPLAFAFLCLALGAIVIARRAGRRAVLVGAGLTAAVAVQLAAIALFPSEGRYPFSPLSLAAVVSVSTLGGALAWRSGRARVLAAFFALWGIVALVAFVVPSPFGDNLARLRGVVFPLVLLAAVLARFRPRWLTAAALTVAFVYNLGPDVSAVPKRIDDARSAEERFWAPVLAFLATRATPDHRVEVVPTFGHWEAYWVPRAGFALARGWYRQLDIAENPELYEERLSAAAYRGWLRRMGVRWVLLPDVRLGPMGARREAELLRTGDTGLRRVFATPDWTVYEVPAATPILSGSATARIERLDHDRIAGTVAGAGSYRLRIRYTPYWRVAAGDVCLHRSADGMTELVARRAGRFVLAVGGRAASC